MLWFRLKLIKSSWKNYFWIQVLLKLAQSLSSNIDANIKALQESGKDAYVVFNKGDLPIGVTIKNGKIKMFH